MGIQMENMAFSFFTKSTSVLYRDATTNTPGAAGNVP